MIVEVWDKTKDDSRNTVKNRSIAGMRMRAQHRAGNANDLCQTTHGLPVTVMEEFVSNSLSLLLLEREAELSRGEAVVAAQLQQPKLLESKGICLLRLKVSPLFYIPPSHNFQFTNVAFTASYEKRMHL